MRPRSGAHALVQHRAVGDARINPVAEPDAARLGGQSFDERLVNRIRDQNAIHRDADLPHVGERAARRGRRRFRDVGVVENDERALAAELQRQSLHRVGGRPHHRLAGRRSRRSR